MKRLRSALTNGGVAPKAEAGDMQQARMDKQERDVNMDDKGLRPVTSSVADPSKADVPALGRRFSDVAASVPIKKRRLLNMEVARSPSPPRRPIKKQEEPEPVADNKSQVVQVIEDSEMTEGGVHEDGRHAPPADKEQRDSVDSFAGTGLPEKVLCTGGVHHAPKDVEPLKNPREDADAQNVAQVVEKVELDLGCVGSELGSQRNGAGESQVVDETRHEHAMRDGVVSVQPQLESEDVTAVQQSLSEVRCPKKPEFDPDTLHKKEAIKGVEKLVATDDSLDLQQVQTSVVLVEGLELGADMPSASDTKQGMKPDIPADVLVEERSRIVNKTREAPVADSEGPSNGHLDVERSQVIKEKGASRDIDRSSGSKDVRLHWDLNMDMEEWERPTEDGVVPVSRKAETEPSNGWNRQSQAAKVQPCPKVDTSSSLGVEKETGTEAKVCPERDSGADTQRVDIGEFMEYDEPEFDEEEPVVEGEKLASEKTSEKNVDKSQAGIEGAAKVVESWDISGEEFEAEHVDYDDSDNNDAGPEPDERLSAAQQAESQLRADEPLVGSGEGSEPKFTRRLKSTVGDNGARAALDNAFRDKPNPARFGSVAEGTAEGRQVPELNGSSVQGAVTGSGIGRNVDDRMGLHSEVGDRKPREFATRREDKWSQGSRDVVETGAGYVQRSDPPSRTKSTGWDQLPEGFENPADALRAVKDPGRAGRVSLWSGPVGRGNTSGVGAVSSRFSAGPGRALPARMESLGDRVRLDDGPWGRDDGTRGRRVEESMDMSPRMSSPRDIGRGRSRGRGGSPASGRGRGGRGDPWLDAPNGPGPWGPSRHPSPPPGRFDMGFAAGPRGPPNAAAMAAAKVESSGFVVAPDGTITKAESPGGSSLRGGPRVGRGVGPGLLSMGRGPGMGMGVGPVMGVGMRVGMGLGRGLGMGPGLGMNVGMGMGGMGVGPGVGMGMPGRGAPGGRGGRGMDSFSSGPGYSRGMPPLPAGTNRGADDYPNGWMRRDRSVSPARPRGRSRSKSRSGSRTPPRLRTPPRPSNSGGQAAGRKRSRSPGLPLSPARRSVPAPPKLPLPPPPPRNQRSPPAGLKRLSDKQREGERPRERERPPGRVRSPPRRTSPHVVHGSSLMDERDRALLAGIRHVSPPIVRHRQDGAAVSSLGGHESVSPGPGAAAMVADTRPPAENIVKKEEQVGSKLDRTREGSRAVHERDRDRRIDSFLRRDPGKDEDRVKVTNAGRPGPVVGSFKLSYPSSRDGDDDVAPRRRRPSP